MPTLYDVMEMLWDNHRALDRIERKVDRLLRNSLDNVQMAQLTKELKQSEKDLTAAIEAAKIKS